MKHAKKQGMAFFLSLCMMLGAVPTMAAADNPSAQDDTLPPNAEMEQECPRDASCPIDAFADANPKEWYHDGIHYCLEQDLMHGKPNAVFDPEGKITRAELVQILYNAAGKPSVFKPSSFADVPVSEWYAPAVAWAEENKVVFGTSKTTFEPQLSTTREQAAAMLYRLSGSPEVSGTLSFQDAAQISSYAYPAMLWLTQNGIITGTPQGNDNTLLLNPLSYATRAEGATMIMRYFTR